MASYTANYNLRKDASTDNYDVTVVNQNLDEIDAQMHQNEVASTTPFTGASSSANGEKGIVPRPMAGDEEKYLKGDGTWGTPSGGGGGSTVTITPTLLSGTKIADYSINGVSNSLYAPSGGGGSSEVEYSTTEHKVGTWIDGSDVYEKTIVLRENGTNNYTYSSSVFSQCLPANIGWIDIVSFYSKRNTGGYVDCMNISSETNIVPNPSNQSIYYQTSHNASDVIVTIHYTKTGGNS